METKITKVTCKRCGHVWVARKEIIRVCPKCKSPYWDTEKEKHGSLLKKSEEDEN